MKSFLASASAVALLLLPQLSLAAEKIRVVTPRNVEPKISAYAEVVDGDWVVEATPSAEGTQFEIYPWPKGQLISPDMNGLGYLSQLNNDTSPIYAFRFDTWPPESSPDHYNYFFSTSASCGSHCGGPQLVYDTTREDDEYGGAWLVIPRGGGDAGYFVRWYDGETEVPVGHTTVYLMREAGDE